MAPRPEVVISPKDQSLWAGLRAIWSSRDLLHYLVRRDMNGRYRPTSLGRSWVVLRPALEILTYVLVFGLVLRVRPPLDVPYPIFLVCGLVPWLFFHQTVTGSASTLAGARHIMSKVHFPRMIVPLTNLYAQLIDFAILMAVVGCLLLIYRVPVGAPILALPFFLLLMGCFAFGLSLLVAAASVDRADVTIATPVLMRVWMYLSPIVYPATLVPEPWRSVYELNPIAVIVGGVRWSLGAAESAPSGLAIAIALVVVITALYVGIRTFVATERRMVDFL